MVGRFWLFLNPSPQKDQQIFFGPSPAGSQCLKNKKLETLIWHFSGFFFCCCFNSSSYQQTQEGWALHIFWHLAPLIVIFLELLSCPDKLFSTNLLLKINLKRRCHFSFGVRLLSSLLLYTSKIFPIYEDVVCIKQVVLALSRIEY